MPTIPIENNIKRVYQIIYYFVWQMLEREPHYPRQYFNEFYRRTID